MNIIDIDHLVLTVSDFDQSVDFYTRILGMRHEGRSLFFGTHKINMHRHAGEFSPFAQNASPGSADFCLSLRGNIDSIAAEIEEKGGIIELGPVARTGAKGEMLSLYLRDPDGNLVELAVYP